MPQRAPASMRTRQSLSDLIEGRLASPDGRAELVKLATRLIPDQVGDRGSLGGGEPRRAGTRVLRTRGGTRPGLAQRRAAGPAEDGGGDGRLCGAADRRARRAVPLADPRAAEGLHSGARGPGGRAAGPRPVGARPPIGVGGRLSRTPSRTRRAGCSCRARRSRRSASGCGRTTRSSRPGT